MGAAAEPRSGLRRVRRPAPELVAIAGAEPAGHVGPGQDGHDARLRGVPGLPALRADAPDLLQPPGLGGDDGVLGEPPQRAAQRRAVVPLPPCVRRDAAGERVRPLRGHPVRLRDPPGDAGVPRQQQLHRRAPQREPRPRAPRAALRGHRRLHRGTRQGRRPDPHRLARRHPAGQQVPQLGRLVRPWRPLGRAGAGDGLHRREPRTRRPRPHPPLHRPTWPTTR